MTTFERPVITLERNLSNLLGKCDYRSCDLHSYSYVNILEESSGTHTATSGILASGIPGI